MKRKYMCTVRDFMESYEGFNWEKGTIVIVENNRPKLFQKGDAWYVLYMEKYKNKHLLGWTHDKSVMVMTVE